MHVLLNISRSKGNQTMKFGQVIDYNKEKLYEVKAISLQQSFNTFQ